MKNHRAPPPLGSRPHPNDLGSRWPWRYDPATPGSVWIGDEIITPDELQAMFTPLEQQDALKVMVDGGDAAAWELLRSTVEINPVRRNPAPTYPLAGAKVSGLEVAEDIPNLGSLGSTLDDWTEMEGIREVPLSEFGLTGIGYSKTETDRIANLAGAIRHNGWISPLIVVIDKKGPYILEGGHRAEALFLLGIKTLPALVAIEATDDVEANPPRRSSPAQASFFDLDLPQGSFAPEPPPSQDDPLTDDEVRAQAKSAKVAKRATDAYHEKLATLEGQEREAAVKTWEAAQRRKADLARKLALQEQRENRKRAQRYLDGDLLMISYGLGVDSTAVLVGLWERGIRPDLVTFADTGNEKPETYAYLPIMQAWLKSVGFPPVTVVRYVPETFQNTPYSDLEGNCLSNGTLPSLAFGGKGCSLKWKTAPQNKYRQTFEKARREWKQGRRCVVAIGYDCSPADSRRCTLPGDLEYRYWYPLRDWGWMRADCKAHILAAGLPEPPKSACFFCPAVKPHELTALTLDHPDLADRIIAMEANAAPKMRTPGNGLWRSGVKGTGGGIARSGRMTDWIARVRAGDPAVFNLDPARIAADEVVFTAQLIADADDSADDGDAD